MERSLKLVVVGDAYSGKTSLLKAYSEKVFVSDYHSTIFENWAVTVNIEQTRYTINFFDTAGQDEHGHLRVLSYPNANVFLLCFSLVNPESLDNCESRWLPEIRKYVGEDVPVLLVGTKDDLIDSVSPDQRVDLKLAQWRAKEMGCVGFIACSSLTHRGLKRVFDEAILHAAGAAVRLQYRGDKGLSCGIL